MYEKRSDKKSIILMGCIQIIPHVYFFLIMDFQKPKHEASNENL